MCSEQDWGEESGPFLLCREEAFFFGISWMIVVHATGEHRPHRKVPKATFNTSPSLPGLRGFSVSSRIQTSREKIWDILNLQEAAFLFP